MDGDLRGLRIGVPTNYFLDGADAPVLRRWRPRCAVLTERGATVSRFALPLMDAVAAYGGIVSRAEAAPIHAEWMRTDPQAYGAHISGRMYPGYAIPAAYYIEALSRRGPILKAFAAEVFAKVDVLVTPTIRTCLPTLAETDIDHGPPGTEHRFMAVSANTRPFNYLGLPAISVPCGFDPERLPDRPADRRPPVRRGPHPERRRRLPVGHTLALGAPGYPGGRGMSKPKVAFIGTGGTIASLGRGPLDLQEYAAAGNMMQAEEILARWPETALVAE